CASPRPARSSRPARSRSTTPAARARASTAICGATNSRPSPTPSSTGSRDVIRLGRISYVNMASVFHRLEANVEEVQGVPTDLNARLLRGELDLAPISSIEYARNAPRLRLLPRLCVSSEGAVDSIQLVTRMSLGRVRTVAVTPESATSVVLTKVLIPQAELLPLEAADEADATLLIGDAAIRSAFEDPTPHFDLGRLWLERTGLPMVFAVWAAPEPVVDGLADLQDALVASVRLARSEPERLAYEASERYGYPPGFLARYFEKLRYSFGPRERAGFYTFLEMARDVGELGQVPELRFIPAESARDREQALEVEVDCRARLLGDLVLDGQVEVVGAVLERTERVLVLGQHRGADVTHVVEEDPRERHVAPVLPRRDLAAAEGGAVGLVRPAEEREEPV